MKNKEIYSNQFKAGKRTYFFDIKETVENKRYLVITESKHMNSEGEFKRNQIMVFQEDIEGFGNSVVNSLLNFYKGIESPKNRMELLKSQHKNAYQPWTEQDDFKLEEMYCKKIKISQIAEYFQRNEGAIRSRIKKLDFVDKYPRI